MDIINSLRNLIGLILLLIAAAPFAIAALLFTRPMKSRLTTAFINTLVDKYTDDGTSNDTFQTADGYTLHLVNTAGEHGAKHWTDSDLVFDNKGGHPVDHNGKPLPGKFI